ncbi:hypothetical protein, partial [Actinacidiphila sp. bgisy167]|uniref:hypothetical protein n=1 Tax=Actinacidiphila sp. bgisy167 TaxID=3413797 RepID=UPI003D732DD5
EPVTGDEQDRLATEASHLSPQDRAGLVTAWRQTGTHTTQWPDNPAPWQPDTAMDGGPSPAVMYPQRHDRPIYPRVDPRAWLARAQDFTNAHAALHSLAPEDRDILLVQALVIMQGRHQAPPATPAELRTAEGDYQSLHSDMTALIAAHLLAQPAHGLDITDPLHPAWQLSEQLREEFATHAPHHETATPHTTGPFIGMALTQNDTTDALQQKILQD